MKKIAATEPEAVTPNQNRFWAGLSQLRTSRRYQIGLAGILLALIGGGSALAWQTFHPVASKPGHQVASKSKTPAPSVSPSASPSVSPTPEVAVASSLPIAKLTLCSSGSDVSASLLQRSSATGSLSTGYARCGKVGRGSGSWLVPTAWASSASYSPVLFFTRPVQGINQLYVYSYANKQETQLTNETTGQGAYAPVFSSQTQQIAYTHLMRNDPAQGFPDTRECELVIGDLATGKTHRLTPGEGVCPRATAWSPDGQKLLYTMNDNSVQPPNGPRTRPFVYDLAPSQSREILPPSGLNDMPGYYELMWRSNSTALIRFTVHENGAYHNTQTFAVNMADLSLTPYAGITTATLNLVQTVGDELYTIPSYDTKRIDHAPAANPSNTQTVAGSEGAGQFLLQLNDAGNAVTGFVILSGQGGSIGGVKFYHLAGNGGTQEKLMDAPGFSAVALGWGADYNTLIWLSYDSGKSSVHQLNLTTMADVTLVDGLQFVQ